MTRAPIAAAIWFVLLLSVTVSYGQPVDARKLEDLRKRYQQGMYITDQALNNLNVHLRTEETIVLLLKSGVNGDALSALRKFLVDIANDRAFLQLELQRLRALFKRHNDTSANIQQLPWSQGEVFHIAVLCDRYLQGQLRLAQLKQKLAGGGISIGESWSVLEALRVDPFVPPITMTDSLKGFVAHADRSQAQLESLATTNPALSTKINNFKFFAMDASAPANVHFPFDWPNVVKSEWIKRYKLLESYGKSTDMSAVVAWQKQLDTLQDIEFSQLVRSAASQTPD